MDEFEKVEKLTARANVSFAEAKEALNASNGDFLDAMIYLEKQGKTATGAAEKSTKAEEIKAPACCGKKASKSDDDNETVWEKIKAFLAKAWQKGNDNDFLVERNNEQVLQIPAWVLVVLIIFLWAVTVPALVIAMFFGCRYSFIGKDDLSKVNEVMGKAGDAAAKVVEEIKK